MLTIEQARAQRTTSAAKRDQRPTPWGHSDGVTSFGDEGLVLFTTPSHGGFYVPELLTNRMPIELRKHEGTHNPQRAYGYATALARVDTTFCGVAWYEEDCEATLVTLAFPELFTDDERVRSLAILRATYPRVHAAYLTSEHYRQHGSGQTSTNDLGIYGDSVREQAQGARHERERGQYDGTLDYNERRR